MIDAVVMPIGWGVPLVRIAIGRQGGLIKYIAYGSAGQRSEN
jgi:hypothetical protein